MSFFPSVLLGMVSRSLPLGKALAAARQQKTTDLLFLGLHVPSDSRHQASSPPKTLDLHINFHYSDPSSDGFLKSYTNYHGLLWCFDLPLFRKKCLLTRRWWVFSRDRASETKRAPAYIATRDVRVSLHLACINAVLLHDFVLRSVFLL